ncbi:hypothetical protein KAU08_02770 [bacterium]|nr:hypothetical protein [bacterium]
MSTINRAKLHFTTRKLDTEEYAIGHLSDETAKLYSRDLYLIGCDEESEILSGNDRTRYTAIVNRISGRAVDVFFDIPAETEIEIQSDMKKNAGEGTKSAQVSH